MPELTVKRFLLVGGGAAAAILLVTAGVAIGQVTKSGSATTRTAASTVVSSVPASTVTVSAAPASPVTSTVTATATVTADPPTTGAAGLRTQISDGTYLVGTDMEPGSYKSDGGSYCYWARLKDDSGSNIIANDLTEGGPARFTAGKGEYVQVSHCLFTKIR